MLFNLFKKKKKLPFKVDLGGRLAGLMYYEGDKEMFVDSEMQFDEFDIAVFEHSIKKWNPPYENEIIDDAERERIFNNILAYLREYNYGVRAYGVYERVDYPRAKRRLFG